jgi:hypothetical protein
MNPFSPHPVPHEFLTFQTPVASVPTNKTAWLMLAPQLLKTPDLYGDQLVASTVIESGLPVMALIIPLHPAADWIEAILAGPPVILHPWSLATYG